MSAGMVARTENERPTSCSATRRLPTRIVIREVDDASSSPCRVECQSVPFRPHPQRATLAHPAPQATRRRIVLLLVPSVSESKYHAPGWFRIKLFDGDARETCGRGDRRVVALTGQACRLQREHPQKKPGRNHRLVDRPSIQCDTHRRGRSSAARFRPPIIRFTGPGRRNTQPRIGSRPGPRPSSFATPAVSGVMAHPSPRYQSGRSMTCQSMSLGRTPPIQRRCVERPAVRPAPAAREERQIASQRIRDEPDDIAAAVVPVLHELQPFVLRGRRKPLGDRWHRLASPVDRSPQRECLASMHRQHRRLAGAEAGHRACRRAF